MLERFPAVPCRQGTALSFRFREQSVERQAVEVENLGIETAFPWFILTAAYHTLGEFEAELAATDAAIGTIGLAWGFVGPGVPGLTALARIDEPERRIGDLQHVDLEDGIP